MRQFAQFRFFVFEWGQTIFNQLHMSVDPDGLECCVVCSLITAMWAFSIYRLTAVITGSVSKYTLNRLYPVLSNLCIICLNF